MKFKLKCPICHLEKDFQVNSIFCPVCSQPMLIQDPEIKGKKVRKNFNLSLEKFQEFLPLKEVKKELSLGEGLTPFLRLQHIEKNRQLYAKIEASNPTLSFKDRGSVVVIHKAVELGLEKVGTVSTGNMASSTAAYAAKAGLQSVLLVKKGTSLNSLISSAVFGPIIIEVDGDYGQLFYRSYELGKKYQIYFANSVDPMRIEGYKLTSLEISLELGQSPDYLYVPVSSGGHFMGLFKGFAELKEAGLIKSQPKFIGVQAEGCAPVVRAFEMNKEKVEKFSPVSTMAHSISNPQPPAGNLVLKIIRENNGFLIAISDDEMKQAQKLLASTEGLFVQPESASTLAAYLKLKE
ncbi:MAG: threonine synthase, partial [Candidatus Saccharicenans sp.]